MALPWATLDGTDTVVSGVGAIALLVPPTSEYLFAVSPIQAAIVTAGPMLAAALAIITSYNYWQRKSIFWAPPAMLAVMLAIAYGAVDLITAIEPGLVTMMAVSALAVLAPSRNTTPGDIATKNENARAIPGFGGSHRNGALPLVGTLGDLRTLNFGVHLFDG